MLLKCFFIFDFFWFYFDWCVHNVIIFQNIGLFYTFDFFSELSFFSLSLPLSFFYTHKRTLTSSLNRLKTHAYMEAGVVQALVGQERISGLFSPTIEIYCHISTTAGDSQISQSTLHLSFCFEAHIASGEIGREIKFGVYFWGSSCSLLCSGLPFGLFWKTVCHK